MTSEYYFILTELSQRLSKDDLNNILFSCGDILPLSTAEKITTGVHLFRELKQRGRLGPANYDYLRKQLVLIGRHDLASMLPDQFEILFGRSTVRDKGYFGCFISPNAPLNVMDTSVLDYSQPSTESRVLLIHLSQQLNSEDAKKLAYLMYPTHNEISAPKFAELLEKEGGLHSYNVINRLSSCLNVVGRVDLAQQLTYLKMPHLFMTSSSLSTLQLQLNLKMRLLLHSKQQSFDFYMKALSEVESNDEVRVKLLGPVYARIQTSFSSSNIAQLIQKLQKHSMIMIATSHEVDFDSVVNSSILEGLKVDQAYSIRNTLLGSKDLPLGEIREVSKKVHDSYITFSSLMDIINWNLSVRDELKIDVQLRRLPFGTPAELACKYIFELSQEVGRGNQEVYAIIDSHIQALNSNCCCYHVIVLQWLASLLCYFTSFGFGQLDLNKFKETLQYVLQQKKEEIEQTYGHISEIVGAVVLQKLIPLPERTEFCNNTSRLPPNPFVVLFNVLVIKLLAAATLGVDQPISQYYLIDNNQALYYGSQTMMTSAAAMKKQVKAFREKVLLEDYLCRHVIAALTD